MSYRRDGTGVATPVWFVEDRGRLLVMTSGRSGKVRRIGREPRVGIAACSATGRLRERPVPARARVLPASDVAAVRDLIARRYRFDLLFVRPIRALQARRHPERKEEPEVVVEVTPDRTLAGAA